ncbi:hypothetical protein GCM10009836_00700 [Pseudonocardia ailaonensis]|uniref:Uncharacterized protein n=1 Tax=Pseudonocardia ailaonensis TaxID=367279 RepID=A0ABN2MIF4_9PSEU
MAVEPRPPGAEQAVRPTASAAASVAMVRAETVGRIVEIPRFRSVGSDPREDPGDADLVSDESAARGGPGGRRAEIYRTAR